MARSKSDSRLLVRLKHDAPEVLDAELDFDAVTVRLLKTPKANRKAVAKEARRNRIKK